MDAISSELVPRLSATPPPGMPKDPFEPNSLPRGGFGCAGEGGLSFIMSRSLAIAATGATRPTELQYLPNLLDPKLLRSHEGRMVSDIRRSSPAALRNREPILDVLRTVLPRDGLVLELASGSGEHVVHFATALPNLTWQPSDPSVDARASIDAWAADAKLKNVLAPLDLDAAAETWPLERADAVIAINMVHISPWAATLGLLRHAGTLLPAGGPLFLYGPYQRQDEPLVPSNAAFDADLRARNPAWGLRYLEDVTREAEAVGLKLDRVVAMPANNLSVLFVRV